MENEVYVLYKVSIHAPVRVRLETNAAMAHGYRFQSTHP